LGIDFRGDILQKLLRYIGMEKMRMGSGSQVASTSIISKPATLPLPES